MYGEPFALTCGSCGSSTPTRTSSRSCVGRRAARRLLAAAAALCGAARHAAADAEECLAGIDPELPGLLATGEV